MFFSYVQDACGAFEVSVRTSFGVNCCNPGCEVGQDVSKRAGNPNPLFRVLHRQIVRLCPPNIENEDKRFHTFVSIRLTIIHDGTIPGHWRYADRIRNTSDVASRRLSAKAFPGNDWWKRGPGFLWQDEFSWPLPPMRQEKMSDDDLEIKRSREKHVLTELSSMGL